MNHTNFEHDKIIKDRSNSFLAYIGSAAEEDMLKECEEWEKEAVDIKIPEEIESRILGVANDFEKKQQNKRRKQNFARFLKTAAIIMLIITVTFSALMISVDALRIRVFDFLLEKNEEYTKIIPVESGENTLETKNGLPADWQGFFYPNCLSEGYQIVETEVAGEAKIIIFQDNEQKILIFTQEPWNGAEMRVNNENVESGQILINGESAFWTSRNAEITLIWNKNNYGFMLYGPVNLEEMITIAENLSFIK